MKQLIWLFSFPIILSCGASNTSTDSSIHQDNQVTDSSTLVTENVDSITIIGEELIEFAISNQEGTQIKVLNTEFDASNASGLIRTIDENNQLIEIEYLKQTAATEKDNHRETPYNFENLLGWLYDVKGKVEPWNVAILFHQQYLDSRTYIQPTGQSTVLTREEATQIETDKSGKIIRSEEVATYPNGMSTYFVEFEAKDSALLVSFVMKEENGRLTYYDFPATKGEYSCWRVDDGCQFEFELFPILGAFKGPQGYELFASWIGAEGTNAYYLVQEEGVFVKKKATYYYQSPL